MFSVPTGSWLLHDFLSIVKLTNLSPFSKPPDIRCTIHTHKPFTRVARFLMPFPFRTYEIMSLNFPLHPVAFNKFSLFTSAPRPGFVIHMPAGYDMRCNLLSHFSSIQPNVHQHIRRMILCSNSAQ